MLELRLERLAESETELDWFLSTAYVPSKSTCRCQAFNIVIRTPNYYVWGGISTPAPIQTRMVSNCDALHLVVSGDTCAVIASAAGISLTNFYAWNPAVGSSCASLDLGDYVCIGVTGSTSATQTTSTGNSVTTLTHTQAGIVTNYDKFDDVVITNSCYSIAQAPHISLSDFYAWNSGVASSCGSLLLVAYCVCTGIL